MQISDFIHEGRGDYDAMFRGILNDPEVDEDEKQWVRERITWAKQTLKKSDRVIWFLRYIKAIVMDANTPDDQPLAGEKWVQSFDPECLRPNAPYGYHTFSTKTFWDQLAHLMALDCPAIKNLQFGKTPVVDLMRTMYDAEAEWAKEQEGRIPANHPNNANAEVILDFGDGWVWMDLHRAHCEQEGSAMGHCGNSPRRHSNDTVLSLRKKIMHSGSVLYEPHLTFTMDEEHYLSERKGRANAKPAPRYQEMIVSLLTLQKDGEWFITGLGSSHWEQHKDFVVDDLSPELRKKLTDRRPEFGNALEYWNGTKDSHPNWETLSQKIMERLKGRYQANVKIRWPQTGPEVNCLLVIPKYFQSILRGEVSQDPYSIGMHKASEVALKRRNRVRELHGEEIDLLLDEVIGDTVEGAREQVLDMEKSLKPLFRIETKQVASRYNPDEGAVECTAIAPLDAFIQALYAPSLVRPDDSGKRTLELIDMEHIIERLQDLMNGDSLGSSKNALERWAERTTINARVKISNRIQELEREDIEKYGDVDGTKAPGDDLPTEDWEIEASFPTRSTSKSRSVFDD